MPGRSLQVIIPENTTHAALALLFILCGQWTGFILNVPLVVWNAKRWVLVFLHDMRHG